MDPTNTREPKAFALVDCNNFFVSCERIFRPDLDQKPVVVLSSNDGCVVARSNEAKQLGIPMGAPAFQWRQVFQRHKVVQFSANFELYSDISRRITSILTRVTPRTEIYSIDESFLDITELTIRDHTEWARLIRTRILRAVGVPVSIGIAPTKTLAKLGADYAKKHPEHSGVLAFIHMLPEEQAAYLRDVSVQDIWGVGRKLAPKLRAEGVHTALDVSRLQPRRARQLMGLPGMQMVYELRGHNCHSLTPYEQIPKTIMRSRTFGEDTNVLSALEAAIANLCAQAAFQARTDGLLAQKVLLFITTSRHKPGYRTWYEVLSPEIPTHESGHLIRLLTQRLRAIYNKQQMYHRAGVTLYDFVSIRTLQTDLLNPIRPVVHDASIARMQAVDAINARFGRGSIRYATEDLSKSWRPKHSSRSPRYVTAWDELPEAIIG